MVNKPKQTDKFGLIGTVMSLVKGMVDSQLSIELMALSHRRHFCIHLHEGDDEYICRCEKVPVGILCHPKLFHLCRFYKADKTRPLWGGTPKQEGK